MFVLFKLLPFCSRCNNHKILDVAFYDEKTLSLLLVEDTSDELPVFVQLTLSIIPDEAYTVLSSTGQVITQM